MFLIEPINTEILNESFSELPSNHEYWPAPGISKGIPRGAVIELFGKDRQEWFCEFLKYNPELQIFWDQKSRRLAEVDLIEIAASRPRINLASLKNLIEVTLRHVIQSQKYEIIVTQNSFTDFRIFQTLQIFLKKSNCTLFLWGTDKKSKSLPISLQLQITKNQMGDWEVCNLANFFR